MTNHTQEAAALLAEFSPALARAFVSQPFNRGALAQAFRAGFRRHSDYSLKVCDLIDAIAHLDQLNRAARAA